MSSPTPPPEQAPLPPAPVVIPVPESRLDQLMAQLDPAKEATKKAKADEKAITDGIKSEALRLAPEGSTEVIVRSRWAALPWKVSKREEWRIEPDSVKAEVPPATWLRWAKKITSWRLDPMK